MNQFYTVVPEDIKNLFYECLVTIWTNKIQPGVPCTISNQSIDGYLGVGVHIFVQDGCHKSCLLWHLHLMFNSKFKLAQASSSKYELKNQFFKCSPWQPFEKVLMSTMPRCQTQKVSFIRPAAQPGQNFEQIWTSMLPKCSTQISSLIRQEVKVYFRDWRHSGHIWWSDVINLTFCKAQCFLKAIAPIASKPKLLCDIRAKFKLLWCS